jgi:hypothetical protein
MSNSSSAITPIVAGPGEGEALWFLGVLATVKASAETTGGAVAVIEHLAPRPQSRGRVVLRDRR